MVAGSGDSYGGPDQTTAEFFEPPVPVQGTAADADRRARPSSATAATFTATATGTIAKVSLERLGAVTHQFDENARHLDSRSRRPATELDDHRAAERQRRAPGLLHALRRQQRRGAVGGQHHPASRGRRRRHRTVGASQLVGDRRHQPGRPFVDRRDRQRRRHAATTCTGRRLRGFTPIGSDARSASDHDDRVRRHRTASPAPTTTASSPGTRPATRSPPSPRSCGFGHGDTSRHPPSRSRRPPTARRSRAPSTLDGDGQRQRRRHERPVPRRRHATSGQSTRPLPTRWRGTRRPCRTERTASPPSRVTPPATQQTSAPIERHGERTPARPRPPGLVGAWSFDAGSRAVSPQTRRCTATTASWPAPPGRRAESSAARLSFDGVNDRVDIPDATSLDLTTGMTLEAWVRRPASAVGGRRS